MIGNNQDFNMWSLLNRVLNVIKSEVTTVAGRVNLISDLVLAAVVVAIFTADALERIAIAFASIWNQKIIEHLSNADALTAFIILFVFFIICLIFLFIAEKISRNP